MNETIITTSARLSEVEQVSPPSPFLLPLKSPAHTPPCPHWPHPISMRLQSSLTTQTTLLTLSQTQSTILAQQSTILALLRDHQQAAAAVPPPAPAPPAQAGPTNYYFRVIGWPEGGDRKRRRAERVGEEDWDVEADEGVRSRSRSRSESARSGSRRMRESSPGQRSRDGGQGGSWSDGLERVQGSSPGGMQLDQHQDNDLSASPPPPPPPAVHHLPTANSWRSITPDRRLRSSSNDDPFGWKSPAGHQPIASSSRLPAPAQDPLASSSSLLALESSIPPGPSVRSTQQQLGSPFVLAEEGMREPSSTREASPPRTVLKRHTRREGRNALDDEVSLSTSPGNKLCAC